MSLPRALPRTLRPAASVWAAAVATFFAAHPATAAVTSYIYVIGGNAGGGANANSSDVWYAPVACDGTLGAWITTATFPGQEKEAAGVAIGNYIYAVGPSSSTLSNRSVYSAAASPAGPLAGWVSTTALPAATQLFQGYAPQLVTDVANAFLYDLDGGGSGMNTRNTYSSPVTGGTVGTWTNTRVTPMMKNEFSACQTGGYAFFYGASICGNGSGMWSALVSGGVIGVWAAQPRPPNTTDIQSQLVACGSYLYKIGGSEFSCTTGNNSSVYEATVSGGTIPAWVSVSPLPVSIFEHTATILNGYIYVIGGGTPNASPNVYMAAILPGGALSPWAPTNPLPGPRTEVAAVGITFNAQGTAIPNICVPCALTVSATPSGSNTQTSTRTSTPAISSTNTASTTQTLTSTETFTSTNTPVLSPTDTPMIPGSPTSTPTVSGTPTSSASTTASASVTASATYSWTGTASATPTPSATFTATGTRTFTHTPSGTATFSYTRTSTLSFTRTWTPSRTPTQSLTFSASPTPTVSPTVTQTFTITQTYTATLSPTPTATIFPPFLRVDRNQIRPGQWPLRLSWAVPEDSDVRIAAFNSAGELVCNLWNGPVAGQETYHLTWDGTNYAGRRVSSNVYILRLFAPAILIIKAVAVVQ